LFFTAPLGAQNPPSFFLIPGKEYLNNKLQAAINSPDIEQFKSNFNKKKGARRIF
jgi:hypothetical protein